MSKTFGSTDGASPVIRSAISWPLAALMLITYVPAITMALPKLLGYV